MRQKWIKRFTKWAHVHELMGGSYYDAYLKNRYEVRVGRYNGFFAHHFPNDKPTPKQYFVLTQGARGPVSFG